MEEVRERSIVVRKRNSILGKGKKRLGVKAKALLIELAIDGKPLKEIAKELEKQFGIKLTPKGIWNHIYKNKNLILAEREQALERARLIYPLSTFEGRVKKLSEIIESLSALKESATKYRVMIEALKAIAQDEANIRELILKEREINTAEEQNSWELEVKEVVKKIVEENQELLKLEELAGWR